MVQSIVLILRFFISLILLLMGQSAWAAFSNFNNVLIGEQASGMGGAYTAMSGDSSSSGFYNPASLVKLSGTDISASATLFNKFDTSYGHGDSLLRAGERVNRGFFRTIPSSIGNVYRWKKWAFGFSLVVPDYDFFAGNISDTQSVQGSLNYTDESLWNGVVGSYKASPTESFGITLYYTARSLIRSSLNRQVVSPTHEIITTEEKSLNHNALVMVLGYLWDIDPAWSLGLSVRPPGLQIHGEGSYYSTVTDTSRLPSVTRREQKVGSTTFIPPRYSLGLVHRPTARWTLSIDTTYFTGHSYRDMDVLDVSDRLQHRDVVNFALGSEYFFKRPKFALRLGAFTNRSSYQKPTGVLQERQGDALDMYGFSGNISFYVSEHSKYTLGGYYSGGNGLSVQRVGDQYLALTKNHHIFSLLVSTSYNF